MDLGAVTAQEDFIALVNHNPDMISKIDKDLVVIYVNDAVCKNIAQPRDFFIGKNLKELTGQGPGQKEYISKIEEVFFYGKPVEYHSNGWFDPSSYFHYTIVPLEDENGNVNHVLSIIKDITSVKKSEDQYKKSIKELEIISDQLIYQNKLLRDFAYITSHNLRSPVANIKALLQLYEVFENNASEKKVVFDKLKNTSEFLFNTVNDLSESINLKGNIKKELEEIYFEAQLEEVKQSLSADIEEAGAVINGDFSKAPLIVYSKIYLESIFLNLLTNSIKYRSPEKPLEVNIQTFEKANRVVLVWKDNGIGIDMEKHGSKLFSLKYTLNEREDSRGIGLYITKNQIESVGGTITVDSKLGEGTKFTIVF